MYKILITVYITKVLTIVYPYLTYSQGLQKQIGVIVNSWTYETDFNTFTRDLTLIEQIAKIQCGSGSFHKPSNADACSFAYTAVEYKKFCLAERSESKDIVILAITDLKKRMNLIVKEVDIQDIDTLSNDEIMKANVEPYKPIPSFSSRLNKDSLSKLKMDFREINIEDIEEYKSMIDVKLSDSDGTSEAWQRLIDKENEEMEANGKDKIKDGTINGKCEQKSLESYFRSDMQYLQLENECRTSSMSACYCAAVRLTQLYKKYKVDNQCPISEEEEKELQRVINKNRKNAIDMGRKCP